MGDTNRPPCCAPDDVAPARGLRWWLSGVPGPHGPGYALALLPELAAADRQPAQAQHGRRRDNTRNAGSAGQRGHGAALINGGAQAQPRQGRR